MIRLQRPLAFFAAILFTTIAACSQNPPSQQAQNPIAPEKITHVDPSQLVQEHPRLFFRKSDLPRMKSTIAALPEAKTQYERLLASVKPDRPVLYPKPAMPTQPDWSSIVVRESSHAAQCAFLFQMTSDPKYLTFPRQLLLGYADAFDSKINFELCKDFNVVEPGHPGIITNTMCFYHSGHLLTNAAMAYDSIYETLTPAQRKTIEDGFFRKLIAVIERFDYNARLPLFASDFMVNGGQWNGANICNMGLTAAGFVLNDARLYDRGIKNFKLQLGRDMLSDGFWVEEDRNYSDTCLATLFQIAWMAKSVGYPEDLFHTVVQAKVAKDYDHRYANTFVTEEGEHLGQRTLQMYLDAHLDYQYPNFAGGCWGWYPNKGAAIQSPELLGMYTAGYAIYKNPAYAFILQHADRSKTSLGSGVSSLFYFGKPVENVPPANTKSRVYSHGRWIALKSIEGPAYWNSGSLYAFMSYSTERTKPVQPLTLDIFGFGKVLAPRVGLAFQAQSLTTDYQLTEPAWNGILTDGRNFSLLKEKPTRSWLAFQDMGPLVKIASPRIHWVGGRQSELYQDSIERHPEEDRTVSRTLAMTDTYLVDIYHAVYDHPPLYHHNFDYVLHGYGKLAFDRSVTDRDRAGPFTAIWTQDGGIGLRSTFLPSSLGSGTKVKAYTNPGPALPTEFLIASRAGHGITFLVVHEPVKGDSKIAAIHIVEETTDHIAVEIEHKDKTLDLLAVRLEDTKTPYRITRPNRPPETLTGNYLFVRTTPGANPHRQQQ